MLVNQHPPKKQMHHQLPDQGGFKCAEAVEDVEEEELMHSLVQQVDPRMESLRMKCKKCKRN